MAQAQLYRLLSVLLLAPGLCPTSASLDWRLRMSWAGHEAEDSEALMGEIIAQDGESTCAGPGHMHSDVTEGFSAQWKHRAPFTASTAQFVPGPASCSPASPDAC